MVYKDTGCGSTQPHWEIEVFPGAGAQVEKEARSDPKGLVDQAAEHNGEGSC